MFFSRRLSWTKFATAVFSLIFFSFTSAYAENLELEITADLVIAATASVTKNLTFGIVTANPGGDSITLEGKGAPATVTTSTKGSTTTGASTGEIQINSAISGINVAISFNPAIVTLTGPAGATAVTVGSFDAHSDVALTTVVGTANNLNIGGVLTVPAGFIQGSYKGTVEVVVNYT